METRTLALTIVVTALYASLVLVLAPLSFGPIQLRVADCLIPLAMVFGWPVIIGVSLGALLSNTYYGLGAYDVILGPLANFLSAFIVYLLRRRQLEACILGAFPIGVIVGGYLWLYFPPPNFFGQITPWIAMMISITLSSLVALVVLGYPLVKSLEISTKKIS